MVFPLTSTFEDGDSAGLRPSKDVLEERRGSLGHNRWRRLSRHLDVIILRLRGSVSNARFEQGSTRERHSCEQHSAPAKVLSA